MKRYAMLLCAAVLVTGPVANAQDRRTRHDQAIAAVRKLGGDVAIDSKKPGAPVAVILTGSDSPGDCLPHLRDINNLHTCDL